MRLDSEAAGDLEWLQQAYEHMMEVVGSEMYECDQQFSHWGNGRRRILVGAMKNVRSQMTRQRF